MPYTKLDKLHIVTAVAVIRRGDGRILILKRREDETVYPGHYTFPGGKVEGNDTIRQTLKSLSFLCTSKNTEDISIDKHDFTDFAWVSLEELRTLPHVGIEAEFIKVAAIYNSHCDPAPFFTDTDQVDFLRG